MQKSSRVCPPALLSSNKSHAPHAWLAHSSRDLKLKQPPCPAFLQIMEAFNAARASQLRWLADAMGGVQVAGVTRKLQVRPQAPSMFLLFSSFVLFVSCPLCLGVDGYCVSCPVCLGVDGYWARGNKQAGE